MALIDCPCCGNEVSPNASSCPDCGEPIKGLAAVSGGGINLKDPVHFVGVLIVVLFSLAIVSYVMNVE